MTEILNSYITSNLIVVLLVTGGVALWRAISRNKLWREAFRSVYRRRRIAVWVCAVYLAIGLSDSIAWVGGGQVGTDAVARHEAKTLLDRAFGDKKEKSYSAPFADAEFYAKSPLRFPGKHVLGTDILGRDVLFVTLKGVRIALLIGGLTTLIAIPLALLMGVLAGFFGKYVDDAVFFVFSVLQSMPSILLLIALITALPKSTLSVCIALAVTSWVGFCRLSRGETMKLRELDYVYAARALGVSELRIIWRHILPNLTHLIVITFALTFSSQVLSEAVLAWLNIGVEGSWGQMIAQAKNELSRDPVVWWNLAAASIALFGLILAINLVGDAIRDVLDPRTARENQ
ncbi:MAG TPA: ABC transporter permease [Polyangiaceae bacterium]|jgi:peptide/nickel transport system permease protein|nr:ABC transporter permease [Polyangiaceae bacterium]